MTTREWLTLHRADYRFREELIEAAMKACGATRGNVVRRMKELDIRDFEERDVEITPQWKYETMWERFVEWMGISDKRPRTPRRKAPEKTVHGVIACPHAPFQDEGALREADQWFEREGVTDVHFAGDLADLHSMSHFTKFEHVPIQREAVEARKIVDWFSRKYDRVWVMEGNHEAREKKYLARQLPPDLLGWFLETSFLQRLTADMENVTLVKMNVENTENYEMGWVHPVGDAVIGHAEKITSMIDSLRGVAKFREWLLNGWGEVLDVEGVKVFLNAHSHRAGIVPIGNSVLLVELGCCCRLSSYALSPTKLYGKPQNQAVTIFEQVGGVTDINSVRQRYLGR